jgi:Uma2 family endonuclease
MNVALPKSLNVDEFLAWAVRQEQGNYELIDGVVIMQQSQTWGHAKVKLEIAIVLRDVIRTAGLPFYAASDGPTVRISERRAFVPDALVAPLPEPDQDSLEIPNPIIVVEVLSPSTARIDASTKLRGYFELPHLQHYLILDPEDRTVTHHRRTATAIETMVVSEGTLKLEPPGLAIHLDQIFKPPANA